MENLTPIKHRSFKLKIDSPGTINIPHLGAIEIDKFVITVEQTTRVDLTLQLTTEEYKAFLENQKLKSNE